MHDRCKRIILPCDCGCCVLSVEKHCWGDGDVDYDIAIMDSRYDHNINTLGGRLKRAISILFGKPVYFNDVYIDSEDTFKKLISDMTDLVNCTGSEE